MKSSPIATFAIFLWIITIAVMGWFFIRGNTTMGTGGRKAIVLQPNERDFVLTEMRGMLSATQEILEGTTDGDMPRVNKAASAAGMSGAADIKPELMAKLPLDFKMLGMSVHADMDDIAKAAARGTPAPEIIKMTSTVLTKCVACHSTWQLQADQ